MKKPLPKCRATGFTLIEIMAAMAVLAIMVVFLGNVFSNTSKVWRLGNKRVEGNNSGRAAIEFIARELSSALVSSRAALELKSDDLDTYGLKSDAIAYLGTTTTPQDVPSRNYETRQIKQSAFKVLSTNGAPNGPFVLMYHNLPSANDASRALENPSSWTTPLIATTTYGNSSVIAENVRDLEIYVYVADPGNANQPRSVPNYRSWIDGPPLFIDIYLEVLASEDAIKAATGALSKSQVDLLTRRHFTRVYMPNATGATRD